jgi:nicotinamide-nucleotide amidase
MDAEIIAVGTEVVMGRIVNGNARDLSRRLPELGIKVHYHTAVDDNPDHIRQVLTVAAQRAQLILLTGGLGPTDDDLTKECLAQFLNRQLVMHQESLDKIESYFSASGRVMTPNNRKQALTLAGARVLANGRGTAPGCIVEDQHHIFVLLPGPPHEMNAMFEKEVMPYLKAKQQGVVTSMWLKSFGMGESLVESKLQDLIRNPDEPEIATYCGEPFDIAIRVTCEAGSPDEAARRLEPVVNEIKERLCDHVYAIGNVTLVQVVSDLLLVQGRTLALAESCTGGLVASLFTDLPGISSVLDRGFVTYSNQAKIDDLGVDPVLLDQHGAVSREVALAMAQGARKRAHTHLGLAITGIAGPTGATATKPVGLVHIAVASERRVDHCELHLSGNRDRIRRQSAQQALDLLRRFVMNHSKDAL